MFTMSFAVASPEVHQGFIFQRIAADCLGVCQGMRTGLSETDT